VADSLAMSVSNFKVPFPPKFRYDVEVKYRPSIPNNVKPWKVFEDDLEINKFLETVKEFSEMHIDQDFEATNNVAEYEALFLGLRAAREMGIQEVAVFEDAELVVQQIRSTYQAKNP
jgi:hypothetical protein